MMLNYGKNYDGYWNGEDVAKQLEEVHVTFLKLHGGALSLYIFDNSANHRNISTDSLNANKLHLKDGGNNTPILRYGFYIDQNLHIVVHTMLTAERFQKGLKQFFWNAVCGEIG